MHICYSIKGKNSVFGIFDYYNTDIVLLFIKCILQIAYYITCLRNQNDYYKDPIVTKISKFEYTKIPFLITRFFQRCSLKQILLLSFIAYHKPYAVMFYCKTSRI